MTSHTNAEAALPISRMRRGGIGWRLTLAFASIAILTALAGTASSFLSLQGGDIVKRLGAKALPTVTASLSFAQRSAVLAAQAPSLATQKDAAALDEQAGRLAAMLAEQTQRLSTLRSMIDRPALLDPVEASSTALGVKIGELKAETADRIAVQSRLDQKVSDTLAAYQALMDFVRPLQEATQTGVDALLSGSETTDESGRAINGSDGLKAEIPILRTLMDIQADGNLAFGMLSAAATSQNDDTASDIRSQYDWAELYLNKALKALSPGADSEKMAKLSADLLSAGSGDNSIFRLKQRLAEHDAQSAALLGTMVQLSSTLARSVDDLVKTEENAAGADVLHSGAVTQQSLVVNGALSGTVLLASLLIGWFYVHRVVVRRMNRLAGTMGKLAAGDRTVDINTAGKDEITVMASAVEVFRGNLLRGDELAGEASRLAAQREASREAGDRDRAAAAAQQALVVEGLADGLARLAKGDLTCALDRPFAPEYDGLRRDFNQAVAQLRAVMEQIVLSADNLRSGTSEISNAADDLSRRTEQQAAGLEQTAAAVDEITATVRRTSEGASHASKIVGAAKADAERSSHVVREAVSAMSLIEQSSEQVGQIIGVIDEIAFQTNLLALNAGVEAARAGDAGRGFAVVASEVRSLAQRSATAAKEIKTLIRASSAQVEVGVNLVGQTGEALGHLLTQVDEINGIVTEIAASAKEQTLGLEQVNTAVNAMDQVTQQNAAMVEQTTAASHSLARDTDTLAGLIGRFRVGRPPAVEEPSAVRGHRAPAVSASPKRVVALKTSGRGGASPKAKPVDWEEF